MTLIYFVKTNNRRHPVGRRTVERSAPAKRRRGHQRTAFPVSCSCFRRHFAGATMKWRRRQRVRRVHTVRSYIGDPTSLHAALPLQRVRVGTPEAYHPRMSRARSNSGLSQRSLPAHLQRTPGLRIALTRELLRTGTSLTHAAEKLPQVVLHNKCNDS